MAGKNQASCLAILIPKPVLFPTAVPELEDQGHQVGGPRGGAWQAQQVPVRSVKLWPPLSSSVPRTGLEKADSNMGSIKEWHKRHLEEDMYRGDKSEARRSTQDSRKGCVALGKLLHLSEPWSSYLQMGIMSPALWGFVKVP